MKLVTLLVAHLQLAAIFTDNMVLQRGQPIHIWGRGLPGKILSGELGDLRASATVRKDSTWDLYFPVAQADSVGRVLSVVSGEDSVRLKNLLIGDVWLCIGQSNMEFPMSGEMHIAEERSQASQPLIRLYNPVYVGKNLYGRLFTDSMVQRLTAGELYSGGVWKMCDSGSVRSMSAVGYYFGKMIVGREHIPVGLIHLAIGGCPIETFMSRDVLKKFPGKLVGNWMENDALPKWVRERGLQNLGGDGVGRDGGKETGSGEKVDGGKWDHGGGPNHAYKPGFAYEAGIAPLVPLPIKGILWYQGESNSQEPERVEEYPRLQQAMVDDYRRKWRQPRLPFYWVQLSSIDTAHYKSAWWPAFRNGQRKLLADIPHGGMAVCSDIGFRDNVHPTNKKAVGERLARWALRDLYGEDIVPSGPLVSDVLYHTDTVTIRFLYARGLHTSDGAPLRGFSFDGVTAAPAYLRGEEVILPVKGRPSTVYYAWQPYTDANLINGDGLPASTFRGDVVADYQRKGAVNRQGEVRGGQQGMGASVQSEKVPVFVSGTEGYQSFRIPAIAGSPNGDLLAFCEGRVNGSSDYGNIDIVMRRSRDKGKTWEPLQVVADNGDQQAGNAAPVVDLTDPAYPHGRIFLFYNTGNAQEGEVRKGKGLREVWYKTSVDDGRTWSEPVNITLQVHRPRQPATNAAYDFPEDWRSYANTPGHAMQFMQGKFRGRIFVAANHSAGPPQPRFADYKAHGYYTDDHGRTFHLGATLEVEGGNESMATELSGDRLMMNSRNQKGEPRRRIVSVSNDGGRTWDSTWYDNALPDPVNQGSILTLSGKKGHSSGGKKEDAIDRKKRHAMDRKKGHAILAFCNAADTARRDNLTLRISYDDGRTWARQVLVDRSATGDVHGFTAYSDMVQVSRRQIGILYEKDNYRQIAFTVIPFP